jgi:hypothetical protein
MGRLAAIKMYVEMNKAIIVALGLPYRENLL